MTYKEAYEKIINNIVTLEKKEGHEGFVECWYRLFGNEYKCLNDCDKCFENNKKEFESKIKN